MSAKCRPYYPGCNKSPKTYNPQENKPVARSTIGLTSSQITDTLFQIKCWWNPKTKNYNDAKKEMKLEAEKIKKQNNCTQLKLITEQGMITSKPPLIIWTLECIK